MADFSWLDAAKLGVEVGGFSLAIFTAWSGINKSHRDRRESLAQAKRDFAWRQTVEAQSAIRRLYSDQFAQNAMTILDWNARHFKIREGLRERITWDDMRNALRVTELFFTPKEVFIRNSFDALFDNFQLIQQQVKTEMFAYDHILYPIGYYSVRICHPNNWPAFEAFLLRYNFTGALEIIKETYNKSVAKAEVAVDTDLEYNVKNEEYAAGEYLLTPGGFRRKVQQIASDTVVDLNDTTFNVKSRSGIRDLVASEMSDVSEAPDPTRRVLAAIWTNASDHPIEYFETTFVVPKEPSDMSDQLIYIWPGIQNLTGSVHVLQSVLQWGDNEGFGGKYWQIANWIVQTPEGGGVGRSKAFQVKPGDVLTSVIRLQSRTPHGFSYTAEFLDFPETLLTVVNSPELMMSAEALETYRISDSRFLPNSQSTTMNNISIRLTGRTCAPSWQRYQKNSYDFGQHIEISDNKIDLFYR